MEPIDICQFKTEDLETAIVALGELRDVLVPFFRRNNLDGMGEEDARTFAGHLALAQHALAAMEVYMDFVLHSRDPKRLCGRNGLTFQEVMRCLETAREESVARCNEQTAVVVDVIDMALFAMRLLWSAAGTLPVIDEVADG